MVDHDGDEAAHRTVSADRAGVTGSDLAAEAAVLAARRYQPLDEIARGGAGRIVRAHDLAFDRVVALKEPLDPVRGMARLRSEASILAILQHPSIVPVYDSGIRDDGIPFFAMKLVDGRSLRDVLRDATTLEQRLALIPQLVAVSDAVAYAHSQSVIHRDLTPANVLIGRFGETILIDWGLAKVCGGDPIAVDGPGGEAAAVAGITATGAVIGTPAYMAPEQARGEATDARSDVYALGAMLYHVLAGAPPFAGHAAEEAIAAAALADPEPLEQLQPRAPADLVAIVAKAMARRPADRYATAAQMVDDLRRFQTGRLVTARRYSPVARARRWIRKHRRGAATASLAAAAAAVIAIVVIPSAPAPGAQCGGAGDRAQLLGIWDPMRAAVVKAAFLASKRPYAADTFDKVAARLNRYTGEWAAARVDACRATHARGEQSEALLDLRMACLHRLRADVGTLVDVLARSPGPDVVNKAVEATARLAPLEACSDTEALQATVPPPTDPAARAEVERIRLVVARVKALNQTGQYEAGLALAMSIVHDAERVQYPPILAELLGERALLEQRTGKPAASEATVRQALLIAADARDDVLAAGLWADLVYQVGEALGRPDDAMGLRTAVEAALRRARNAPRVAGQVWANLGLVLVNQGKLEEARSLFARSLELRERELGVDSPITAGTIMRLGGLFHRDGKLEPARQQFERALAIYERALGSHPLVGMALNNVGDTQRRLGNYPEARRSLERALEVYERTLGPEHLEVASSLHNLGILARAEGTYDEAEHHYQRALSIRSRELGPRHRAVADLWTSLGVVLQHQGRYDEARENHERALAIYEDTLGRDHPHVAYPLNGLGDLAQVQGRHEDARRMHERAIAVVEKAYGRDHPELAVHLTGLADALLSLGRPAEASLHAGRAVQLGEASGGQAGELAVSRFTLARTIWPLGDRARARSLALQARDGFAAAGRGASKRLADAEDWLARHRER